jgi:hypothetical protein
MITDINSEDRLVQKTFAEHLEKALGWESVCAYNTETFGPHGTLGRISERDVVLGRDLCAASEPGVCEDEERSVSWIEVVEERLRSRRETLRRLGHDVQISEHCVLKRVGVHEDFAAA